MIATSVTTHKRRLSVTPVPGANPLRCHATKQDTAVVAMSKTPTTTLSGVQRNVSDLAVFMRVSATWGAGGERLQPGDWPPQVGGDVEVRGRSLAALDVHSTAASLVSLLRSGTHSQASASSAAAMINRKVRQISLNSAVALPTRSSTFR